MPFRILNGLRTVDVTPEEWEEWHAALNRKLGDRTRTLDSHVLVNLDSRVRVTTMFVGGPELPWLTFVTGWPGVTEYSACLGHAREQHHAILQLMMADGWKLNAEYKPETHMRR